MRACAVRRMLVLAGLMLSPNVAAGRLVGYWSCDDTEEGVITDWVGNHHGTMSGSVKRVPGYQGTALQLSGNGYAVIGRNPAFDLTRSITVAAWFKAGTLDRGYETILCKGRSAWAICRDAKRDALHFTSNSGKRRWIVAGNAGVCDGKWHHVAGTFDGSKACLYVDGQLDASVATTTPLQLNDYDVCLGENLELPGRQWNGCIDEVMIFDHSLTEAEVTQLYRQGAKAFVPEVLRALRDTTEQAQAKLRQDAGPEAIAIVQRGLARHQLLNRDRRGPPLESDRLLLSDTYFLLADAKERAGAPKKEVAALYATSALFTWESENFVPALLWLYHNTSVEACRQVIRRSMPDGSQAVRWLPEVARSFHARYDWAAFELFVGTVFSEGYGLFEAYAILNGLGWDNSWGRSFLEFARRRSALRQFFVDANMNRVNGFLEAEDFPHAADVCRDVARFCTVPEDIARYEFKACECAYRSGSYEEVIREIDRFIGQNATGDMTLVRKAWMLKGRAQIHLKQTDQACDTFQKLVRLCPKEEAAEANFYVAYVRTAQGSPEEAEKVLRTLLAEAPGTAAADKARLYMKLRKKTP